jgi:type II secretory pathway component PulF
MLSAPVPMSPNVFIQTAPGGSLADSLGKTGVMPPLVLELISVGENSGALGEMLGHVADLYDAEMDTRLTALAAAIIISS